MTLSVEEFIDAINDCSYDSKQQYEVIETFKNLTTYKCYNLQVDIEDGTLWFGDLQNVILDNRYVLGGVVVDSIRDIQMIGDDFILQNNKGQVTIRVL